MADLPVIGHNSRALSIPARCELRTSAIKPSHTKNLFDNAALEKFSTANIEKPTEDQLEFERLGLTNLEAGAYQTWRNAARGDKQDYRYAMDRTVGPVITEQRSLNLTMTLSDYLKQEELNDADSLELEEAGIIIAEVVTPAVSPVNAGNEDDYAADL